MFNTQNDPCMAMKVIMDGIQHVPPIVPPLSLLTAVVSSVGVVNSTQDLYAIIIVLIQNHTSVSIVTALVST